MKVVSNGLRCERWRQLYVFYRQAALVRRTPFVLYLHATWNHLRHSRASALHDVNTRSNEQYRHGEQERQQYVAIFLHYGCKGNYIPQFILFSTQKLKVV